MIVHRGSRSAALVACLAIAAALVSGCGTAVPDVKGKTADQASRAIAAAGFKPGAVRYDENAEGAAGAVIAQEPAAGERAADGSTVLLTVAGPAPVQVPSIVGLTRQAATAMLVTLGLDLGDVIESYEPTAPAGQLVQQEPPAGTVVPKGTLLKAVASKGPQPVETSGSGKVKVPAVKGLKLDVAKSKISAAGLKWKYVTGAGDGMTDHGYVYKQSPAGGTTVAKGSVVTIYEWVGP